MASITPIPEVVPERSVTSLGINWLAADSAAVRLDTAHVHVTNGQVELSGIQTGQALMTSVELVDSLNWEQVQAALIAHCPDGAEVLLLVSGGGGLTAVSVPTGFLYDQAGEPEFRAFLAHELATRVQTGQIAVVEDNMTRLLSYAGQFAQYAPQADDTGIAGLTDASALFVEKDFDSTVGWQDRPGSIFLYG